MLKTSVKFWQDLKFFVGGMILLLLAPGVIYREVFHRPIQDGPLLVGLVLGAFCFIVGWCYLRARQAAEKYRLFLNLDPPLTPDDVIADQGYANKVIKEAFAEVDRLKNELAKARRVMREMHSASKEQAIENRKTLCNLKKSIKKALSHAREVRSVVRRNGLKTFSEAKYATF